MSRMSAYMLMLSILFISMFFRAEYFSIDVMGLGVKPFHIFPAFFIFIIVIKNKFYLSYLKDEGSSVIVFSLFFLLFSIYHIFTSGLVPSYVRSVYLVLMLFSSFLIHFELYKYCGYAGVDFRVVFKRVYFFSALTGLSLILLKNLYFFTDLWGQFSSGALRAKTPWNFMNYGPSINNEVVFYLMFLPFILSLSKVVFGIFFTMGVFMLVSSKVDAAYLYVIFYFMICGYSKWRGFTPSIEKLLLHLGLIILPFILVSYFLTMEFVELSGGERGRYFLWNYGLETIKYMNFQELISGGVLVDGLIESYDDAVVIGHNVQDFHNLYFNLVFEYGLIFIFLYLYFFYRNVIHKCVNIGLSEPIVVFLLFTILSSWFTPRGFDYFFWFFVPSLWFLSKPNIKEDTHV